MKPEELEDCLGQIKDLWSSSAQGLNKIRAILKKMSKKKGIGCEKVIEQICLHQCGLAEALLEFNICNKIN